MISACSKHALYTDAAGMYLPSKCLKTTASRRFTGTTGELTPRRPHLKAAHVGAQRGHHRVHGVEHQAQRGRSIRLPACPPAASCEGYRAQSHSARPASARAVRPTHNVLPGTTHLPHPRRAGPART